MWVEVFTFQNLVLYIPLYIISPSNIVYHDDYSMDDRHKAMRQPVISKPQQTKNCLKSPKFSTYACIAATKFLQLWSILQGKKLWEGVGSMRIITQEIKLIGEEILLTIDVQLKHVKWHELQHCFRVTSPPSKTAFTKNIHLTFFTIRIEKQD